MHRKYQNLVRVLFHQTHGSDDTYMYVKELQCKMYLLLLVKVKKKKRKLKNTALKTNNLDPPVDTSGDKYPLSYSHTYSRTFSLTHIHAHTSTKHLKPQDI